MDAELATRRQQVADRIAALEADLADADQRLDTTSDGVTADSTYASTLRVARDGLQRQLDRMRALAEQLAAA